MLRFLFIYSRVEIVDVYTHIYISGTKTTACARHGIKDRRACLLARIYTCMYSFFFSLSLSPRLLLRRFRSVGPSRARRECLGFWERATSLISPEWSEREERSSRRWWRRLCYTTAQSNTKLAVCTEELTLTGALSDEGMINK